MCLWDFLGIVNLLYGKIRPAYGYLNRLELKGLAVTSSFTLSNTMYFLQIMSGAGVEKLQTILSAQVS